MTALWTESELTAAFGAAPSAPVEEAVGGVSIDTRTLQAGDIFVAVRGETRDGHDHVARAFEAGAAAAVATRERAGALAAFGPLFAVDDTLKAMERLRQAPRSRSKGRRVPRAGSGRETRARAIPLARRSAR